MAPAAGRTEEVLTYLERHERKELLRFLTCGSVDDGKSTLIGRLLHDSQVIYEDQLQALERDSQGAGGGLDLALLVDGLQAEREQGITIDVAYRYFATDKRKFIIADTPGHEQYTRNMVTGASTCDVAVILIDAGSGTLTQTKRHTYLARLLGIRHLIVAVNKMDAVGYSEAVFNRVHEDYLGFAERLGVASLSFVPISALHGDNVVQPSTNMAWYRGATLMHLLESVPVGATKDFAHFRMAVQRVNRPDAAFRGYSGTVAGGVVRPGDSVLALPSGKVSEVARIVTMDGDLDEAFAPMAVTLTLTDDIDVSRGDMLASPERRPHLADVFEAHLVWLAEAPLDTGRQYLVKHGSKQVYGQVRALNHRVDVNTLEQLPAATLKLNEVGLAFFTLAEPIGFDPYRHNRATGAFIVIDPLTNATVGAGMIEPPGAQTAGAHWDEAPRGALEAAPPAVSAAEKSERLGQAPVTVLLTGVSMTGKTAIAQAVERKLFRAGRLATVLDGQAFRLGMSRDLGFSAADRSENLRRAAEAAKLVNAAGLICLTAFVVPHERVRERVRQAIGAERFLEVFLTAPLATLQERDERGLYAAAQRGELPSFPGVTSTFDPPTAPDLTINTAATTVEDAAEQVVALLRERGFVW